MNPLEGILVLTGGCFHSRICNQAFPSKKIIPLWVPHKNLHAAPEAWDFAQKYSANEMMKIGTIMLLLAGAIWLADIPFKGTLL